ncbi:MAG: hypothetical protein M1457_07025, partial [bacterium]|nr:hypothetical protein [bacterium]
MKREPGEPLFIMTTTERRRPRLLMGLTMLAVLVVIIFGVLKIIPIGPEGVLSGRKTRRQMAEAARLASQSQPAAAAQQYQQVLDNPKVSAELRAQAAQRLADLFEKSLDNPAQAAAALRQASALLPAGETRENIDRRLKDLTAKIAVSPEPGAGGTLIARIGDQPVTLEEILYAWSQYNGGAPPDPEEFEPFVHWYLDMALLADQAGREGLQLDPKVAFELRLKRLLGLNQALLAKIVHGLPAPDADTLRRFYATTRTSVNWSSLSSTLQSKESRDALFSLRRTLDDLE